MEKKSKWAAILSIGIIFLIVSLLVGAVVGFLYAEYTSEQYNQSYFRIEGYFTRIEPTELSLFDEGYPYFTRNTGAGKEQAEDYKLNPQNYAAYQADIFLTNNSDFEIESVWPVLPGTAMYFDPLIPETVKEIQPLPNRTVWLNAWLEESWLYLPKGERYEGKLHIIVKKEGLSESERKELLSGMTINIQAGVRYFSNRILLPDKVLYFDTPICYRP